MMMSLVNACSMYGNFVVYKTILKDYRIKFIAKIFPLSWFLLDSKINIHILQILQIIVVLLFLFFIKKKFGMEITTKTTTNML